MRRASCDPVVRLGWRGFNPGTRAAAGQGRLAADASSPSRSGRSRCPRTGFSARSPASRSTPTTTSGSAPARDAARRREGRAEEPARDQVLQGRAAGAGVRRRRQSAAPLGRAGPRLRLGRRTSTASTSTRTAMSGSAATTTATRSCSSRRTENSSCRSARTTAPRAALQQPTRLGRPAHMFTDDAANESTSRTATATAA